MKKIILNIIFIISMAFILPILFTTQFRSHEVSTNSIEENTVDYGKYSIINLLHSENGIVENLALDTYLYGVVAAEMPASYNLEALKAQSTVARTYTIYKIINNNKHENADICDDSTCCQAWISKENRLARWGEDEREANWKKIVQAVDSTAGNYITYDGEPINAFFHSNSGGATEVPINVWGGEYPYLQVVETSGENAYSTYASEVIVSKDELIQKMLEKYSKFEIDFNSSDSIKVLEYNESGRVKKLKVGNINLSGVDARQIFELKSAKFSCILDGENIKFTVTGYGHGVGLSQSGSDSLAKQGYNYKDIIKHYYKNVEITE